MLPLLDASNPYVVARRLKIRHTQFKKIYQCIGAIHRDRLLGLDARSLIVSGQTGAGKSWLINSYIEDCGRKRRSTPTGDIVPILSVEVPGGNITPRGLGLSILNALGDPGFDNGTQTTVTVRLADLLKKCHVEIVFLDDFHHLVNRVNDSVLLDVADWLKGIIKHTQIPFVVVGITGRIERVVKKDEELSRMFAKRELLTPFAWSRAMRGVEFEAFVKIFFKEVNLTPDVPFGYMELMARLYYATDGFVANISSLLCGAVEIVSDDHQTSITLPLLIESFETNLKEHLGKINPFLVSPSEMFIPPTPVGLNESGSIRKRKPKPSDILSGK